MYFVGFDFEIDCLVFVEIGKISVFDGVDVNEYVVVVVVWLNEFEVFLVVKLFDCICCYCFF